MEYISEMRADFLPNFKPEHIREIEDIIREIAEQEENCPERHRRKNELAIVTMGAGNNQTD